MNVILKRLSIGNRSCSDKIGQNAKDHLGENVCIIRGAGTEEDLTPAMQFGDKAAAQIHRGAAASINGPLLTAGALKKNRHEIVTKKAVI